MRNKNIEKTGKRGIILLEDLAPIKDVKGGSGKILFGERVDLTKELFPSRFLFQRKKAGGEKG